MSGAVLPLGRCEFCEQRASRPPSQGGVPRRGRPAPCPMASASRRRQMPSTQPPRTSATSVTATIKHGR